MNGAIGIKYVMVVFSGFAILAATEDLIFDSNRYNDVKLYKEVT